MPPRPPTIARSKGDGGGFTLVELLVVVAVVAVLLGLALPVIRGARQSAGAGASLSNLRGIGIVVELYTQRHAGVYPFHGPDTYLPFGISPPDERQRTLATIGDVWSLSYLWPAKMHEVAPWRDHYRSWLNAGRETLHSDSPWREDLVVSYRYTCSFFASPETWTEGPPLPAEELIKPVSISDVRFPALKALMYDKDRAYLGAAVAQHDRRGVLLADGSASLRSDAAATTPVQNRVDAWPPRLYSDTPLGVKGRDVP